jgi:light-regulated signal transduction histidine kinase (bacteriophytochrome)
MLRNVTELEQAKNDLERKNKDLSNFAHMVSHDLKDPLNTISSIVELIKIQFEDKLGSEGSELIDFISNSTGRMKNLITDILEFSSIGERKDMTKLDCNELVHIIQQDLKAKIEATGTSIEVGNLPVINGYRTEMRVLFQNLVSNAIKFNRPGESPKIKISAQEKDGWTFSVEDNGIGIAEENQEKIFSIFQRLHDRSEYEGTGIGLAHCKKIIDLHKGDIWVESEPGKGSTFNFTIPK